MIALVLYWLVFFAYTLGMLAVVKQSGIGRAQSRFLVIEVMASATASGTSLGWGAGPAWLLVPGIIVTIAFLLASQCWRALSPRPR